MIKKTDLIKVKCYEDTNKENFEYGGLVLQFDNIYAFIAVLDEKGNATGEIVKKSIDRLNLEL